MGANIYTWTYNIGAYNSSSTYVSNAYTQEVSVVLNNQHKDSDGKYYSNFTITWRMKGNSGFYYSASGINYTFKTRNSAKGESWDSLTTKIYKSNMKIPATGTWYTIGSWTGDLEHDVRGNVAVLDFYLVVSGTGSTTTSVYPRKLDKNVYISAGYVPDISVNITIPIMVDGEWKNAIPYILVDGVWKESKPHILIDNVFKEVISS